MVQLMVTNIFNKFKRGAKPQQSIPAAIWQNPLYFIAFGFGSGAIPFAPGTFGTLLAIPFYLLLQHLSPVFYITFVVLFCAASIWICERVSNEIHIHDHPGMNLDEFVGFFVTMIFAPAGWQWILLGFLLFRLFDIWKPWPISWLDENIPGGFGMIIDDVVAGLFSFVVIQLMALFILQRGYLLRFLHSSLLAYGAYLPNWQSFISILKVHWFFRHSVFLPLVLLRSLLWILSLKPISKA